MLVKSETVAGGFELFSHESSVKTLNIRKFNLVMWNQILTKLVDLARPPVDVKISIEIKFHRKICSTPFCLSAVFLLRTFLLMNWIIKSFTLNSSSLFCPRKNLLPSGDRVDRNRWEFLSRQRVRRSVFQCFSKDEKKFMNFAVSRNVQLDIVTSSKNFLKLCRQVFKAAAASLSAVHNVTTQSSRLQCSLELLRASQIA